MGNRVSINPCKFVDYDLGGNEVGVSFGYRIFDDYETAYNNISFDSLRDVLDGLAKDKVLGLVINNHSNFANYLSENKVGLSVGEQWFDYDDLIEKD